MSPSQELIEAVEFGIRSSGLRQSQVAAQAGITSSHMSEFLQGKKNLGKDKLSDLSRVISIPSHLIEDYDSEDDLRRIGIDDLYRLIKSLVRAGVGIRHLRFLASAAGGPAVEMISQLSKMNE